MKSKTRVLTLLILGGVVFIATFNEASSFSGGALVLGNGTAYAGGPAEQGRTCATSGCHNSFATIEQDGWITIDADTSGYIADSVYTISIRASDPNASVFGFMASPQNASGNQMGGFIASGNPGLQVKGGSKYITHTVPDVDGSGTMTWTFEWLAPSSGAGPVTIYAAINAANNDGGTLGDQIYTTWLTVPERPVSDQLVLFPNPATTRITVAGIGEDAIGNGLRVVNLSGQLMGEVRQEVINGSVTLDVSRLPSGIYFVQLDDEPSTHTRFVKIAE